MFKSLLAYIGFLFLMVGAFLMEWSFRGFAAACREVRLYLDTRNGRSL